MTAKNLSVRELEEKDIELITQYWTNADEDHLLGMGVDLQKLPGREEFMEMLKEQLNLPYEKKKSYCIIWLINNEPSGHSNINKIIFGEEAFMHLHIWNPDKRKRGNGVEFVKMTLPYFFSKYKLKRLFCEPYALNPAPNKTIQKAGFKFIKQHTTIPGYINFEQKANLWEMSYDQFLNSGENQNASLK